MRLDGIIRYFLNDNLLKNGGHIGDEVRPSERRKGIATKMIGEHQESIIVIEHELN